MEPAQNVTAEQEALDAVALKIKSDQLLKYQQEQWIDYCAVGGLLTDADGNITQLTVSQFADQIKLPRGTLYRWRKEIPQFWDKVAARRLELGSGHRLQKVINGVWLRASKGDAEQAKIYLGIFANWQPPSQKHEVNITGLGDLANIARRKGIIDGEVVNAD